MKMNKFFYPLFLFNLIPLQGSIQIDKRPTKRKEWQKKEEILKKDGSNEFIFKDVVYDFSKEKREERKRAGKEAKSLFDDLNNDLKEHLMAVGFDEENVLSEIYDNLKGHLPSEKVLKHFFKRKIKEGYPIDYQRKAVRDMHKKEFKKWTSSLERELVKKKENSICGKLGSNIPEYQDLNLQRGVIRDFKYKKSSAFVHASSWFFRIFDEVDYTFRTAYIEAKATCLRAKLKLEGDEREVVNGELFKNNRRVTDYYLKNVGKLSAIFTGIIGGVALLSGLVLSESMRKFTVKVIKEAVIVVKKSVKDVIKFVKENKKFFLIFMPAIFFGFFAGYGTKKLLEGGGFPSDFNSCMSVFVGLLVLFLCAFFSEKLVDWYYGEEKTEEEREKRRKRKRIQTFIYATVTCIAIIYLFLDLFYLQSRGFFDLEEKFDEHIYNW